MQHRGNRAFAVRSGNMNDFETFLGISEVFHRLLHAVQARKLGEKAFRRKFRQNFIISHGKYNLLNKQTDITEGLFQFSHHVKRSGAEHVGSVPIGIRSAFRCFFQRMHRVHFRSDALQIFS